MRDDPSQTKGFTMGDVDVPLPPVEPNPQVSHPAPIGDHAEQQSPGAGRSGPRRRKKKAAKPPAERSSPAPGLIDAGEGHIDFRA